MLSCWTKKKEKKKSVTVGFRSFSQWKHLRNLSRQTYYEQRNGILSVDATVRLIQETQAKLIYVKLVFFFFF